jgi:riboflavin synthase
MFTGLIEEVGAVEALEPRPAGSRLRLRAATVTEGLKEGDSVAVSGVCLTAVDIRPGGFSADVSPETLRRSSLGALRTRSPVNLERALRATSRLGGHIVQGHVDGVGVVESLGLIGGGNWWLRIAVPEELDRYFVFKGSVAIDGISLTIAAIEDRVLSVTIIPHTYENTTLRARRPGDAVNLETDVLAKYVEKMLATLDLRAGRGLTAERLRDEGW